MLHTVGAPAYLLTVQPCLQSCFGHTRALLDPRAFFFARLRQEAYHPILMRILFLLGCRSGFSGDRVVAHLARLQHVLTPRLCICICLLRAVRRQPDRARKLEHLHGELKQRGALVLHSCLAVFLLLLLNDRLIFLAAVCFAASPDVRQGGEDEVIFIQRQVQVVRHVLIVAVGIQAVLEL